MADTHYDVIIIGSGPGGGATAARLAPTGKRILILERGDYLPRSTANWDSKAVFVDAKYQAKETWFDSKGNSFAPGLHYFVGGNSKVYGAALLRMRERDFGEVQHAGGVSPAWPLPYSAFEPYYTEAERLFQVHGQRGEDPYEPPFNAPFPYPAVSHEKKIESLDASMRQQGLKPFHLPLGILLDEKDGKPTQNSACIRCDAFDGFPCMLNAKADAQVVCIDPTLKAYEYLTLLTNAYVSKLITDPSGKRVSGVMVERGDETETYTADVIVVACGALSSALLLLRSANDKHPNGLANRSGQLGRNYMRHNQSILMALTRQLNDTVFQKTLALSDFYFGSNDWKFPLGLIQMCASTHGAQIKGEVLPEWLDWFPDMPFEMLARHSLDFWLTSEDLPRPENRIYYDGDRVMLDLTENNMEAHIRLRQKLKQVLSAAGMNPVLLERKLYFGKNVPIGGTAHQCGTARFGNDPQTSVLDTNCRTHDVENLYLTDASFFPSSAAVNPTLTIIANALRVADVIKNI
jgi:choline dehydrogenase-like flavoprotein